MMQGLRRAHLLASMLLLLLAPPPIRLLFWCYASEKRFEAMSSSNSASLSCVFVWSLSLFSSPSKYESNAASANGESDGESDGDRQ